ncbi:MAG TPA: amidohydrolase family protein, partial [Candidatus Goldiibacteriota bacterium]|nr:amidohydrolase family protein [Candidatus Goldiibacteriota bacterium]
RERKRPKVLLLMSGRKAGSCCLGIYLEGPFINQARKGAIKDEFIADFGFRPRDLGLEKILRLYPGLRIMAIAPELPGTGKLIRELRKHGVIASFGHSDAGHKEARRGVKSGIRHVTHLFNAMRKWNEPDPSYVALLADKRVMAEVIADGRHLPPKILRMVVKKFGMDRIILVSDATGGKGLYAPARLAGTSLPLIELVRRMKRFCGIGIEGALRMATYNPAKALAAKAGYIGRGYPADMIVLDRKMRLRKVFKAGKPL